MRRVTMLTLAVAMILTACGDDDSSGSSAADSRSSAATAGRYHFHARFDDYITDEFPYVPFCYHGETSYA